jgi:hypothetical protein
MGVVNCPFALPSPNVRGEVQNAVKTSVKAAAAAICMGPKIANSYAQGENGGKAAFMVGLTTIGFTVFRGVREGGIAGGVAVGLDVLWEASQAYAACQGG